MQTELPENKSSWFNLLNLIALILIIMTPVGFIIMLNPSANQFISSTTLYLAMQAFLTILILIKLANLKSVVICCSIIFAASWFLEYFGLNFHFPFGNYTYTDSLIPKIKGVPKAIPLAWLIVVVNSLLTARFLFKGKSEISSVALASVFVLSFDILLEPFASFINRFWIWENDIIPIQNYISWFIIGLIFLIFISHNIKWIDKSKTDFSVYKYSVLIILINIINFSAINIYHGFYIMTSIGLIIFVFVSLTAIIFSNQFSFQK